jgi:hypothetical protein
MKVTIDHSDIQKGGRTFYTVRCAVEFNEEEKSIIRERSLSRNNHFGFEHGFVNYPVNAGGPVSPGMVRVGSRLLFLIGLPLTFFSPPLATLCWASAAGLFFYRKSLERTESKAGQTSITLDQVLRDGSFTVTAMGTPLDARQIEEEIHANLEGLKSVLTASAEMPKTRSFEM